MRIYFFSLIYVNNKLKITTKIIFRVLNLFTEKKQKNEICSMLGRIRIRIKMKLIRNTGLQKKGKVLLSERFSPLLFPEEIKKKFVVPTIN